MAGRFPGADSVDELWDLLVAGRSTAEPAPVDRLGLPQTGAHAGIQWWGNFLRDPTAFDHKFFQKSTREAVAWDPQQRILLEVIYEALESCGHFGIARAAGPDDYGCYIGAVMNNYYDNLTCHAGTAYATIGTSRSCLSGCMSHYFGWTGPALTIDTACSSSLVAVNAACRAIWSAAAGDPVEVLSIRDAFGGPDRDSVLHFASIKGNIGHTEATAGVSGLIKVLLMMRHRQIPRQASHSKLNPKLPAFGEHQMQIPQETIPWDAAYLLACVNSSGAAGSNAAVMVQEGPAVGPFTTPEPLSSYPVFISAGSKTSLASYCAKLVQWLGELSATEQSEDLASILFHLADRGNHRLPHIFTTSVQNISDLTVRLQAAVDGSHTTMVPQNRKPAILVFGGQEGAFVGLSQAVYKSSAVFRAHLDSVNDILESSGLKGLYPLIFETKPVTCLISLHAALFAVQYASAMAWIDGGLRVSAVVGHSFGHLTALCIARVLSLADALKLVTGRAAMMQEHWGPEPGCMLQLQAKRETVAELVSEFKSQYTKVQVEIACFNGPESHVVVGSCETMGNLQQYVATHQSSICTRRLNVTHGFHSHFTEPLLPYIDELAKQLEWQKPKIHIEMTDEHGSVTAPTYDIASKHTRQPVFFGRAIERLANRFPSCTLIEAGRGSSVLTMAKDSVPDPRLHSFHSPQLASATALDSLTTCTVDLWRNGHAAQFWPFHRAQKSHYAFVSLPPIQFDKTRHWLGFTARHGAAAQGQAGAAAAAESRELLSFSHFQDGARSNAVFRINPTSDRFQSLVGGHIMAGEGFVPASLYFEVVSRAALFLQGKEAVKLYVPTVKNLAMTTPIGKSTTKSIVLLLRKLDGSIPSWSFSITTQDIEHSTTETLEHSTGTVHLTRRDDTEAARELARFQTLVGHARWQGLVSHPEAEKMRGSHIYRAFNTVVQYGEAFRGIKDVACVDWEAAGTVQVQLSPEDPADQRLCDTSLTDSFMQVTGFLVNYFNNSSMEDIFVCGKIDRIAIGGDFDPDAGEWFVYANMSEGGETDISSDVYVFEARSRKLVLIGFGFRFSKIQQSLLGRMLNGDNKVRATVGQPVAAVMERLAASGSSAVTMKQQGVTETKSEYSGKRQDVHQILSNITDLPLDRITDDSTLDDLGVDSLMATEALNDIRTVVGITIDLSSFLFFPNVRSIVQHIDDKLGLAVAGADSRMSHGSGPSDISELQTHDQRIKTPPDPVKTAISGATPETQISLSSVGEAFEAVRLNYDGLAQTTGAAGFWENAYPEQARLVLAYVVEAFADLGCDVRTLQAGDPVPQIATLSKHAQLVQQLYRILEDSDVVTKCQDGATFHRTSKAVENVTAESMYHDMIDLYPQHAATNTLVRAVGSELAACLRGRKDGIQVLFGNRETKKTLEDVYEFSPLLRTATLVLGDFLAEALSRTTGTGKLRLLEIGAGTGGTTRYIISLLQQLGVDYEYLFTDLGSSLVSTAARRMQGTPGLLFQVLDIEKPPPPRLQAAFHVIIATNCIHATRNLETSLRHARQMLRPDGALTLIEVTKNMYWLDMVVGLLEGWWLFEDGRRHALVDEEHWERSMKAAGFREVAWSDGATPESKTVRVVAAFLGDEAAAAAAAAEDTETPEKPVKAAMETFVYKEVDGLEIQADVYYPTESGRFAGRKLPVALMIHGGSHMVFSRKDTRPAQTRLLLSKGLLPVSIDYRLCPEVSLSQGAMVDVCDALDWCRRRLPAIARQCYRLDVDVQHVVVVGWSSGGQLAMSLGWTAPARGLAPPSAALVFYAPTDYEDAWWLHPIHPRGAMPYREQEAYDVLEGVREAPIAGYDVVGAWEEPLANPDPRCRLLRHVNWKAQTLPVILAGLPSKKRAAAAEEEEEYAAVADWAALPQPPLEVVRAASPRAHVRDGTYSVPTFFVHGTADDLVPWQQTRDTHRAMREKGLETGLVLLEAAPHICDLSGDPGSEGWQATLKGYDFICLRAHRVG